MTRKLLAFCFLCPVMFYAAAQTEKGRFFYRTHAAVNFCQIDGDGASGFNKFGYTIGTWVGQGLGNDWTYESGFALSSRGSRRPFNPDEPAAGNFHFHYSMIDIPLFVVKKMGKYSFGPGLRTTWLLNATDKENTYLNLRDDMRSSGLLGCAMLGYTPGVKLTFRVEYQYSLASIRIKAAPTNPLFPTGVYHNVISAGITYNFSNSNP